YAQDRAAERSRDFRSARARLRDLDRLPSLRSVESVSDRRLRRAHGGSDAVGRNEPAGGQELRAPAGGDAGDPRARAAVSYSIPGVPVARGRAAVSAQGAAPGRDAPDARSEFFRLLTALLGAPADAGRAWLRLHESSPQEARGIDAVTR